VTTRWRFNLKVLEPKTAVAKSGTAALHNNEVAAQASNPDAIVEHRVSSGCSTLLYLGCLRLPLVSFIAPQVSSCGARTFEYRLIGSAGAHPFAYTRTSVLIVDS
jgi:hypothetical protein